MATYRPPVTKALADFSQGDKLSNQVVFSGTNESYSVSDGILFIEFIEMDSGTATIKDGLGNTIATGLSSFSQDHSPLRCDYGITIEGDVSMAKGFVITGILEKKQ